MKANSSKHSYIVVDDNLTPEDIDRLYQLVKLLDLWDQESRSIINKNQNNKISKNLIKEIQNDE